MVTIASLWLPILISGVVVFFLSFVMWMVLPHHKNDWKGLPDEDGLMDALRKQDVPLPGQYVFPYCADKAQMNDPEFLKKYAEGPAGMMVLRPKGPWNMGKSMAISTLFNLIVAIFVAYVATFTLVKGSTTNVFRLTSITAFLAFAGAHAWAPIWWGRSWASTFREMFDGLVYGCAVGLVFHLMWP